MLASVTAIAWSVGRPPNSKACHPDFAEYWRAMLMRFSKSVRLANAISGSAQKNRRAERKGRTYYSSGRSKM